MDNESVSEPAGHSRTYRPDIDGLRAVAVLAVVLYHLDIGPLRGGFTGVDIFFVISGYLITSIIHPEIEQGRFTFSGFYERRVRRLFPALFLVLFVSIAVAFGIMLPHDLSTLGRGVIAALLFASNLFFWQESGYFALAAAELNPLLHTWSLAVEEQFYIGFPILLLVTHRYIRRFQELCLLLILLATLVACVTMQARYPSEVFYLSPFRAWELLAGALLAVGFVRAPRSRWQRESLAALGLIAILVGLLFIEPGPQFPGWQAIFPVAGTAALIHVGVSGDSMVNAFLRMRPLVYVGAISYSLYLWHWPLLVFVKFVNGLDDLGGLRWWLFLGSLGCAIASYHLVEQPFRRRQSAVVSSRPFVHAAFGGCLIASLAIALVENQGFPTRFGPAVVAADLARHPVVPFLECIVGSLERAREQSCQIGDRQAVPRLVVWGDSHALAWAPAIDQVLRRDHQGGLLALASACPPLIGVRNPASPKCEAFNRSVINFIVESNYDTVMMIASWTNYSHPEGRYTIQDETGRSGNDVVFPSALRETVRRLRAAGKRVWLVGPTPGAPQEAPLRVALARAHRRELPPPISFAEFRRTTEGFDPVAAELAAMDGVVFTDPSAWFCDGERCSYMKDGVLLYRDDGHLSLSGAEHLVSNLAPLLLDAMAGSQLGHFGLFGQAIP